MFCYGMNRLGERYAIIIERIFKIINQELFENEISTYDLEILSGSRPLEDYYGCFIPPVYPESPLRIEISSQCLQYAEKEDFPGKVLLLFVVLLHEMIHLYCYQNLIKSDNHNDEFMRVAQEHGLHSVYENGECKEEWLLPNTMEIVKKIVNARNSNVHTANRK